MPIYDYKCGECGKTFTKILRMSERKTPEQEPCPHCGSSGKVEQVLLSAPGIADPCRIGVTKADSGFKEVLAGIHQKTPGSQLNQYL